MVCESTSWRRGVQPERRARYWCWPDQRVADPLCPLSVWIASAPEELARLEETRTADVFSASRAMAGTEWQSLIKTLLASPDVSCMRFQIRAMEQHRRGSILRGQFSRVGMPRRRRRPVSLACREHAALHPRRHLSGRSLSHPSQAGRLRQATLLRLQHTASQSVLNIQSGSLGWPLSPEPAPSSGNSVESVEQPASRSSRAVISST